MQTEKHTRSKGISEMMLWLMVGIVLAMAGFFVIWLIINGYMIPGLTG